MSDKGAHVCGGKIVGKIQTPVRSVSWDTTDFPIEVPGIGCTRARSSQERTVFLFDIRVQFAQELSLLVVISELLLAHGHRANLITAISGTSDNDGAVRNPR